MKELHIGNVNIFNTTDKCFYRGDLEITNGIINAVNYTSADFDPKLDFVIPGLVDVHTHGRCGYDFDSASVDDMAVMRADYARAGTTTVMPSLATSTLDGWLNAIDNLKEAGFDGIHLEGRYLNIKRRGAHDPNLLVPLDSSELRMLLERMRPLFVHVTAAPELDGGEAFCRTALSYGATVGIGHSDATYEEATRALGLGATSFTHTFNAMSPIHHRYPGTVTAALLSDAYAEFICDGVHLVPEIVALAWRVKRHDRFVLITDSMMATGYGDGDFTIGGLPVRVKNSVALTGDGTIAGSTLDLFRGMINLIKFAGASFEDAVTCATINPARMVGMDSITGILKEGRRADLCVVSNDKTTLKYTVIKGCIAE
jgi:N-acetylglucosamine-6-phosphate deacetylase